MDEILKSLLNDLKQSRNNLSRYITAGFIFAFFGQFYVIEPYFSLKNQEKVVEEKVLNLSSKKNTLLEEKRKAKEKIKTIKNITETTKRKIDKLPDELRNAIYEIRRQLENPDSSSAVQSRRLMLPQNIKSLEDGVRWYVSNWSEKLIKNIKKEIDESSNLFDSKEKAEIEKLSAEIKKSINFYIKNINPDFWRAYQGKISFAHGLKGVISDSFSPLFEKLSEKEKDIDKNINNLSYKIEKLEESKEKIQKEKELLRKRLSSIESPIGKLPVNLTDFIKTFPVLVFLAGIVIAYTSGKNRTYGRYFVKEGLSSGIEKDKLMQISRIYSIKEKTVSIVLLILLIVVVRSSFLIVTDKELFLTVQGNVIYSEFIFYSFVYTVSAVGLAVLIFNQYKKS